MTGGGLDDTTSTTTVFASILDGTDIGRPAAPSVIHLVIVMARPASMPIDGHEQYRTLGRRDAVWALMPADAGFDMASVVAAVPDMMPFALIGGEVVRAPGRVRHVAAAE